MELESTFVSARRPGRPRETVPAETTDAIANWLADGRTLRSFSQQPGNPSWRTIYDWLRKDPEFRERLKLAREIGFDALADECLEIADTEPPEGADVRQFVQQQRLRIDTRLKLLARWSPQRYGKRVGVTVTREGARQLSDIERAHRIQALLDVARRRAEEQSRVASLKPTS